MGRRKGKERTIDHKNEGEAGACPPGIQALASRRNVNLANGRILSPATPKWHATRRKNLRCPLGRWTRQAREQQTLPVNRAYPRARWYTHQPQLFLCIYTRTYVKKKKNLCQKNRFLSRYFRVFDCVKYVNFRIFWIFTGRGRVEKRVEKRMKFLVRVSLNFRKDTFLQGLVELLKLTLEEENCQIRWRSFEGIFASLIV